MGHHFNSLCNHICECSHANCQVLILVTYMVSFSVSTVQLSYLPLLCLVLTISLQAVSMHENLNKSALRSEGRKSVTNYLLLAYPVCVQNKLPMTLKVQDKHSKEVSHRQSSSIPSGDVFNFATIPVGSTVYLKAQVRL